MALIFTRRVPRTNGLVAPPSLGIRLAPASLQMVSMAPTGLVLMAQASQPSLKSESVIAAMNKLGEKRRVSIAERYNYTFRK